MSIDTPPQIDQVVQADAPRPSTPLPVQKPGTQPRPADSGGGGHTDPDKPRAD